MSSKAKLKSGARSSHPWTTTPEIWRFLGIFRRADKTFVTLHQCAPQRLSVPCGGDEIANSPVTRVRKLLIGQSFREPNF